MRRSFVNFNNPDIGMAARAVLAINGVATKVEYPRCCGMPQLEHGEIAKVAESAKAVAAHFAPIIDEGWDVVALTPSCALMLKFEWPLIVPDDPLVQKLSKATFDISEYVVDIAKKHGLPLGLKPLDGGVSVHLACHARAQNVGPKAAELLRLIPGNDGGGGRAMFGPWRLVGRDEGELRRRAQGRQAGRPHGRQEQQGLAGGGVSARGRSHRAGRGSPQRG